MDFITVRDLRLRPADIWRRLRARRDLILTTSGRPIAVLVGLDDGDDVDATLQALRRARAQVAVSRMRRGAADSGADRLSAAEIEAEIAAARREREP